MLQLLLFVVVIGFALAVSYWQSKGNKQRITKYLFSQGASDIVVSLNWSSRAQGSYIYNVEYADRQGVHRVTRCRVGGGWFSNGDIYWSEPPEIYR
jgi:hypothetical protein